MTLCNRCELLFGVCRPLIGQPCSRELPARATHQGRFAPALVLDHRTWSATLLFVHAVNLENEPQGEIA